MSVPRHFCQRPRHRLAPPPHRGARAAEPVVEEPVVEEPVEVTRTLGIDWGDVAGDETVETVVEAQPEPEPPVVEAEPEPEVEAPVEPPTAPVAAPEPKVEEPPKLKWDMTMKKADLLAVADKLGAQADESMTKAQIVAALDAFANPGT